MAGFSFLQGMFYANREATVQMANDGCFYSVNALKAIKEPEYGRVEVLFDGSMDTSALKLAEMAVTHPDQIKRIHYNVLVRVRDYRRQYGRHPDRIPNLDYAEVDRKIDEAIAYLESIHDMDEWVPFKVAVDDGEMKVEAER